MTVDFLDGNKSNSTCQSYQLLKQAVGKENPGIGIARIFLPLMRTF